MNRWTTFFVVILVGGLLGACQSTESLSDPGKRAQIESMYEGYRDDFPGITEVTPAAIADSYRKGELLIVDVREEKEQAVSMIPGALTKAQFEAQRAAGTLGDKSVVVHCTIGYRSGLYAHALKEQGVEVKNLKGSLLLWSHEGLPLETPDGQPTKKLHVFGGQWDLLAEGYEGVW